MKFDFDNSAVGRMYKDTVFTQKYLDTSATLLTNFGFWTTQFSVDPVTSRTDDNGLSSYSVESAIQQLTPMADMRAPLGRPKAIDKLGVSVRTGSIPNFIAPSDRENAFERYYNKEVTDYFGTEKMLLLQWTDTVQQKIDSLNQTLSNMSAQLLSKGEIDYQGGRGITGFIQDNQIDATNKVKAGKTTWSSPDCKIFDQMAQIEEDLRMRTGYEGPLKWQIPYDMFHNVFLTNAQVIEWVRYSKSTVGIILPEIGYVTEEDVMAALAKYSKVSPIEIIVEKQKDYTGVVHGWSPNAAVLRPAGYAGVIKHADNFDRLMHEAYGSSNVSKIFANVGESGLYTLCNIIRNNDDYKTWSTEVMGAFVPVLTEWQYHVIVDTESGNE